jgi:hypothetical protein
MSSQVEQPDSPKSSSGARDTQDADAKAGAAEPKEPKPKGSGRADCLCFVCNRVLPLSEFSGSQKKKKRDCRKCLTCALLPVPPGVSAPRTPRPRKKSADSGEVAAFVWVCVRVCVRVCGGGGGMAG